MNRVSHYKKIFAFTDIMEYLYHTKIPEIKNALTDEFLPRIAYKNGKIYLINAENNNAIRTDTENDTETDTE